MAKEARLNLDVDMTALDAKIEELRQVTAIANGALKDMRTALKEAREIVSGVSDKYRKDTEAEMQRLFNEGVKSWAEATKKGIDVAEERINKRFDKLGDILLGEEGKNKRPPLEEDVRRWMEKRGRRESL